MTWRFGEDYVPFEKRGEEIPEQRIRNELTETAQKMLACTIDDAVSVEDIKRAHRRYIGRIGEELQFNKESKLSFISFIENPDGDQEEILTFIEVILNTLWLDGNLSTDELTNLDQEIRRILAEEQILLELRPPREMIPEVELEASGGLIPTEEYDPSKHEPYNFEELADTTVIEADQEFRALTRGERWEDVLEPYNEAWELYRRGPPATAQIPEKLYNSVENVLQRICVDEGWENDQQTWTTYLDRVREEGLLEPNERMVGEWQQILSGVREGIQKTGDRKNWHNNIDQDYCLLLLHQSAAFISFIIKRYENQ
jgi:hypothetical protein